eukprot:4378375-Lingulodinium_polyedra.AAC.1
MLDDTQLARPTVPGAQGALASAPTPAEAPRHEPIPAPGLPRHEERPGELAPPPAPGLPWNVGTEGPPPPLPAALLGAA